MTDERKVGKRGLGPSAWENGDGSDGYLTAEYECSRHVVYLF